MYRRILTDTINKNDYIIISDCNDHIDKYLVKNIIGTNGERTLNENGKTLKNIDTYNKLRITNSFFTHKDMQKFTWTGRIQIICISLYPC
jgi:hypothetical protein